MAEFFFGLRRSERSINEVIKLISGCAVTDSENCYDNIFKKCDSPGTKERMVGLSLQAHRQRCVDRARETRCWRKSS